MGAVTDEFTKRIMFGNFMGIFDNEVENAAKEIKALAIAHIREHLYPGHGYLTGNLSESYQGTVTSGGGQATITIFTECVYAAFVEYGTYKMAARAHFRPGLQQTEEEGNDIFAGAINAVIG